MAHVAQGGGSVLVRMNLVTLPLFDADGERINILALARTLKRRQCAAWPVHVHHKRQVVAGRLCVVKKTQVSADKSCQRVRRESQRSQTQLQPQTLEPAEYVMALTTPGADFAVAQLMELYRAHWQIELVFKRQKSLAELGHLKKRDPAASQAWLRGKLLVALLRDALLATTEHFPPPGWPKAARLRAALARGLSFL